MCFIPLFSEVEATSSLGTMVLKQLVFMVAVAVLEGVTGLQEKPFANGTQIKANPDHKKRGRRLDKLPCITEDGTCQRIGDLCDGIVRQGPEWCLHDRHFECCYPRGCYLNDAVYPNGAIAQLSCMILRCVNGNWYFDGIKELCGICCTSNTTDVRPYVTHDINGLPPIRQYSIRGLRGAFSFTQYGFWGGASFGIDISLSLVPAPPYSEDNNVDCMLYYEPGIHVEICCFDYPLVYVSTWGFTFSIPGSPPGTVRPILHSGVYILYTSFGICIIGTQGLTVCVYVEPSGPICPMSVCSYASPTLFTNLYGLCDVWIPIPPLPEPQGWTCPGGLLTTNTNDFIKSWKLPISSGHKKLPHQRKNPSSDHSGQVTNRTVSSRSMMEIEKSCEEMYKGPCTILSSEECEEFKEICMSRISASAE